MLQRLRRTTVALVAITSVATAQPLPDPRTPAPSPSDPRPTSSEPRIPITLRPGEVLGGDAANSAVVGGERVVPAQPPLSIEHPIDPETYFCGPGDVFELDFWGSQNLQLKLTTDLEGRAFIAKVGFITVAGKTLAAVRTAMKSRIRAVY